MMIILHHVISLIIPFCVRFVRGVFSDLFKNERDKSKVMDAEYVLAFDPPMYCQRYGAVQEILTDPNRRGAIKTLVDFGCSEFGIFNYVKNTGVEKILFVDVDVTTLEYYMTKVYPLTIDYLRRRRDPLDVTVLNGNVANPSLEVMDVDAVLCIEMCLVQVTSFALILTSALVSE